MDLSVVIPTYNGAERLPAVLDHLRMQADVAEIAWEVVVVDNNSSDDPATVVQRYQANWPATVPLKYVLESCQGPAYARQCGMDQTTGEFVGFLDDDNWPAPDWVNQAVQFGRAHPQAGSFGGKTEGKFEVPPPEGFDIVKRFLVIRNYGSEPKQFEPEKLKLPAGAGLIVRRAAWQESIPDQLVRVTRGGNDYEISLRMYRQGWQIWYCPEMTIQHFIPEKRMQRPYLMKLTRLYGLCTCELLMLQAKTGQGTFLLLRVFLGSLRRFIQCSLRYRWQLFDNVGYACELSFHWGSTLSPFFYLKNQLQR